jgi:hypothetical protein
LGRAFEFKYPAGLLRRPGERKKKKESDFCLMEREKKKINFQNSIQKDR